MVNKTEPFNPYRILKSFDKTQNYRALIIADILLARFHQGRIDNPKITKSNFLIKPITLPTLRRHKQDERGRTSLLVASMFYFYKFIPIQKGSVLDLVLERKAG